MGVDLKDILEIQEIDFEFLCGKKIAIDAFNAIYQFLSIIRQPDGTPLIDSKNRITSHLSGLFYRTSKLVEMGILPCYVFDGKPPELKEKEISERKKIREEAEKKWKEALETGDLEAARKYAQAASKLSDEMVKESKALLEALGIPIVQAIGEGEAQAAFMCRKGDVWAVASQDFDSLLFGTPRLIRNLTITGKRKIPGTKKYVEISPELIDLDLNLSRLGISQKDLIHVALLIGTDFNEGIKGFGPKKAIKAVKEGKITEYFSQNSLEELEKIFLNPPITESYTLCWGTPDKEKVIKLLVEEHEFSLERIEKSLESFKKLEDQKLQKRLDRWF